MFRCRNLSASRIRREELLSSMLRSLLKFRVGSNIIQRFLAALTTIFLSGCFDKAAVTNAPSIVLDLKMDEEADLMFIHGYGGSKCSWSLIDSKIRESAVPSYIELLGFGQNTPPDGFDFSIESQADYLASILSDVDLKEVTLVAHSLGAAVLLVAAIRHDLVLGRVILVDPLAYQQSLPFFIKGQTIPLISPLVSRLLPPSTQVDIVLNAIYAKSTLVSQVVRNCYIAEFEIPFHRRALSETARQLASFDASTYVLSYPEISGEFHIIWGNEDPLISVDLMPQLKVALRAQSATVIPNCGHAPHEECPLVFVQALKDIIEK